MEREIRIGIAGYGMMGKAHSYAYTAAPVMRPLPFRPRLQVISGRDSDRVSKAAAAYGFDGWVTDWRELVERKDVDVIDICTPPGTHAEIAAAAAAAGKAVLCEKPLAVSYAQAREAADAVGRSGVLNAVGFNYRRLPAVSLMKRMVDEGAIGKVRLWRATWLSDEFVDPAIPFDWRFDRTMGGSTIADLGSHLLDMALWMVGGIAQVCAQSETFVRERTDPAGRGRTAVTVDEASSALLEFESGARGTIEMAR
ncbi:MAG TPA: Gfo/Idh/MocA family oxidoreductase, partial [Patescibacteria group bacterium]|nr:Gfo/Idh/MocA family oxidoreductase [Patescibacteria group bacterium]